MTAQHAMTGRQTAAGRGRTTGRPRQSSPRSSRRRRWSMRDLVAIAVLGAVFGFLYFALVQAWGLLAVAMGPLGDLAQHVLMGGWFVVAAVALYVVRRPGAGLLAEVIAAFVEFAFLGSPVGPTLLLVAVAQGAGVELGFALARYRRYGLPTFLLAGLLSAVANFAFNGFRLAWFTQDYVLVRLGLQVVSGLVLCGLLGWLVSRALLRTGVLDDFAAGRDRETVDD